MAKAGSKSAARAPRVPFAILVVALVVGAMSALLALNTASAANELNRHDLAVQDTGLSAELEQLQNEVAASAAPGNLASVAAALGMVPAANPAFLRIGVDGKLTVLGSP
ncbi:MAG: septum formation initiator family protein, partial [Jatrophihabitantaceae bacterium]